MSYPYGAREELCTCSGASLHLHVGAQRDVGRASGFKGDGVGVEVSQHVRHGVEPQVVDVALAILIHRQTQMLTRRQGVGSLCSE